MTPRNVAIHSCLTYVLLSVWSFGAVHADTVCNYAGSCPSGYAAVALCGMMDGSHWLCESCPANTYFGGYHCPACPQYATSPPLSTSIASCTCTGNRYMFNSNPKQCVDCPINQVGSGDGLNCYCPVGYAMMSNGFGICAKCPAGLYCPLGSQSPLVAFP